VGRIVGKSLSPDGHSVTLTLSIEKRYAPLLHENTRFWDASGLKISGGLINLSVRSAPLESKLGGVDFGTPEGEAMGAPVNQGHVFTLYDSPKKDWLQWLPNIPLAK